MVLPAAGKARRFGSGENKIWAEIAGKTVLERTLTAFQEHPSISGIVVVAGADDEVRIRHVVTAYSKVQAVVLGGTTRAESVQCGLAALPADTEIVLVHDAARPLLSESGITRIIEGVLQYGAAVPGTPLSDTVKRVGAEGLVKATVPRSIEVAGETIGGLTAVQTPQGAWLKNLQEAYRRFDFEAGEPTDEASLLEGAGFAVGVVAGEATNIKITRQEDVSLAEYLLTKREGEALFPQFRVGLGYDVHRFATPEEGRPLFLGGVEIVFDRGLDGHSDADVLLHAVCDAILGAASLGDIGILFPNTDAQYKGISSLKLLDVVGAKLREAGWRVINIDITVLAEAPKMKPHRETIQTNIAQSLGISATQVSVKATTAEKMGFVGREEGIACWSTATIQSL